MDPPRCLLHHRTRPDRGHRRPYRRRQDHHRQPDDAFLRHPKRQHPGRRRRCPPPRPQAACASASASFCRTRSSSPGPSPTTSGSAPIGSPTTGSKQAAGDVNLLDYIDGAARRFCRASPRTRRNPFHRPQAADQLSPARWRTTRRYSFSMKRPPASTPTPSSSSARRSSAWSTDAPRS